MKKALVLLGIAWVCHGALLCQPQPSSIVPPDGQVFQDQDRLCLQGDAAPGTFSAWWIPSPNGHRALVTPFDTELDNGYCLPGQVEPWEPPADFSLTYLTQGSDPRQVHCEIRPSGAGTPPDRIVFNEVSFTKKNKKYYLRLTVSGPLSGTDCLQVMLGENRLPVTRNAFSEGSTVVEGLIGKEDDFVRIASNTPAIALSDSCSGRRSIQPFLPEGKQAWMGSMIVWSTISHKVLHLGVWYTPFTGCEVVFYSWFDPVSEGWAIRNFPTFIKYKEHSDSDGCLPPSYRKILSGLIIWRAYDYCTGEFVGWGMGGYIPPELGTQLDDGTRALTLAPENIVPGYPLPRTQDCTGDVAR